MVLSFSLMVYAKIIPLIMLSIMKHSTINLEENGIDESKYPFILVNIYLVSGKGS